MVHDLSRKPRGYAFIEYERERDMHSAYKHADGKKIEGKRVLVDVEKGRTVKGWLPRRLGGGLGGTRRGGPDVNLKHSGREENRSDDRYIDRDRDRLERPERRRTRSRSRERRRKSRSRYYYLDVNRMQIIRDSLGVTSQWRTLYQNQSGWENFMKHFMKTS
ncbi:U1 small nuclear ribonucleoprotein 70 kDa like protein [Argiope bruennichi]|uniref:U1 small nuclear ribonucleoprotein 70 kDa n=1 Tax=Argiope bruennichi TaxID=94029 RepID=A0A8T0F7V2_ARGBR|nr:U1 small nuclear ribonucleoprotein 70 kDa like protein [Argiope bruennichi]